MASVTAPKECSLALVRSERSFGSVLKVLPEKSFERKVSGLEYVYEFLKRFHRIAFGIGFEMGDFGEPAPITCQPKVDQRQPMKIARKFRDSTVDDQFFKGSSEDKCVIVDHAKKTAYRKYRTERSWMNSERNREMMRQDLDWLQKAKHENVVGMIGEKPTFDGRFHIVHFEYVGRNSLAKVIDESSHWIHSTSVVLKWAEELFTAIEYLSRQKLIHRDLRPENIFLTDEWVLKVCDFSSRKVLSDSGKTTNQIADYPYRPPETNDWMQNQNYDEKGDVYQTGIVLTELLAKRRLSKSKSLRLFFSEIEIQCVKYLSEWFPLIWGCTASDPFLRFSANEALGRIREMKKEQSVKEEGWPSAYLETKELQSDINKPHKQIKQSRKMSELKLNLMMDVMMSVASVQRTMKSGNLSRMPTRMPRGVIFVLMVINGEDPKEEKAPQDPKQSSLPSKQRNQPQQMLFSSFGFSPNCFPSGENSDDELGDYVDGGGYSSRFDAYQ